MKTGSLFGTLTALSMLSCGTQPRTATVQNSERASASSRDEPHSDFCKSVLAFYDFKGSGLLYMTKNTKVFLPGRNPNEVEVIPGESRTLIERSSCLENGSELVFTEHLVGKVRVKKSGLFGKETIEPFEGRNQVRYTRSEDGRVRMHVTDMTADGRVIKELDFDTVNVGLQQLTYEGRLSVDCPPLFSKVGVKCVAAIKATAELSPEKVDFFQEGTFEISLGTRILKTLPIQRELIGSSVPQVD